MKPSADILAFQARLGHQFRQTDLLIRALTHASIASATRESNQRLEFLGDRVLGLAMAEALFVEDSTATEGQLAPRLNVLVRQETCAEVAREIGLGEVLKLGRGEMATGGRRKEALLGDAMEAVIAAIYLDAGFTVARDCVRRLWGARVAGAGEQARDPKTALQEWAQARGMALPDYVLLSREGAAHEPLFTIEVRLENGAAEQAQAGSKRQAEQAAARALLARMEKTDD